MWNIFSITLIWRKFFSLWLFLYTSYGGIALNWFCKMHLLRPFYIVGHDKEQIKTKPIARLFQGIWSWIEYEFWIQLEEVFFFFKSYSQAVSCFHMPFLFKWMWTLPMKRIADLCRKVTWYINWPSPLVSDRTYTSEE